MEEASKQKIFLMTILIFFITIVAMPACAYAYTLTNNNFTIQAGSYGEISSLKLTGDLFPTDYVMNAANSPKQNTSDHEWLGELMFTYRIGTGAWTKALTNLSDDIRQQSQSGNTVTVNYQNSANAQGIRNFQLTETYSLVNDYFLWQITVKNTSSQNLEFGDFGLPLPFNERWPGNEAIYETRTVDHSFTGYNSSYIYVTRPSGAGPFLLMMPDSSTGAGFEYQDHWRTEEHPGSMWAQDQGDWPNGLNVFYIHSNVIKSTNRGYLPNTSLTLLPGQSKTYAFKFFKVSDTNAMKEKMYSEGLIDVNVVPGMIVPTNQTAKFDLHTSKAINSVTAQYPSETTVTYLNTVDKDHRIYQLKMSRLGQNNITVSYGDGEKTVLQFYAIEPIDTAIQRHSTFMVEKTQWNDGAKFYNKAFDDWMMNTKAKRGDFSGYWGWGDDWGYTHGEFLAEKNVLSPVVSEIKALDDYLDITIWNGLMKQHQNDYYIHDFLMYSPGDVSGECKNSVCGNNTPMGRGYAYPHIYNTFFSMYKIAKLYPNAIIYKNSAKTYLYRTYRIMKTLYDGSVAYNWNTGLMGELTTPEIIQALKDEGYTTEANDLISKMVTKYNNFKNTTYPYGSEYSYDNTGEEAVYTLAKMNNNKSIMSKINEKTRACRGMQPAWYYYADPVTICGENWWNFQYTVSLAGYCMNDWMMNYSTIPEEDARLTYAAKIAGFSCINSGQIDSDPANIGTVAWTYQAEKGNLGAQGVGNGTLHNGWRDMAGEADLGLFGAIKILSADVANDPIFGLYGYGCDVSQNGSNYIVTPKDGLFKRLNMVSLRMSMSLEQDEYSSATISDARNYVEFTLKNKKTENHITKVTMNGLAAGPYDIFVNDVKTGSFTSTGKSIDFTVNVGTAATYNIKVKQTSSSNISANIAPLGTPSTSFCSSWESIAAINDDIDPANSADKSNTVYANWDNPGTAQWVQYDFSKSYTISKSDVYWFKDGTGIDLPASCSIQYWNGSAWANVSNPAGFGVDADKYNTTTFTPVSTNKIRLNIVAKAASSTGIIEWKVYEDSGSVTPTPTPTPTQNTGADFKVVTNFSSSTLVPNQMLTAKVTATNISTVPYSGKMDVLVIVGLYDTNNTMVNVSYISKGIAYQGTETLSAGFKLPSNTTGYVARTFMWDGTDIKTSNMIPISNAVQIPDMIPVVTPTNKAPVVEAGEDKTFTLPANITLSGTAGDDGLPAGSALTTAWSLISGSGTATFTDAKALNTTATVTAAGTYVFRLTVSDGALSSSDTVMVTVNPSAGPVVTTPPSWINSFYKKCVMINNIPICSTNAVPDQALINGYYILEPYLRKIESEKPAIIERMNKNGVYVIVIGLNETNSMHPSWAGYDDASWPRRGGGGLDCTVLEEDLIVPESDEWRRNFCGLVHEFSHTMLSFGIGDADHAGADTATYDAIVKAYNEAITANKYTESSYDRSNYHEYFCGQVGRWFNANPTDLNVPNASNLTDRQQLQIYDPEIYKVLSTLFGDYKISAPWN